MTEPSIDAKTSVSMIMKHEPCWMSPIIDFLAEDQLLADGKEAYKVHRMPAQHWLSKDHELYQRSFGGPYLQCLPLSKIGELLTKLYEKVYDSHIGGHMLAHQAMTQEFWWSQMHKDATECAQKCEQC